MTALDISTSRNTVGGNSRTAQPHEGCASHKQNLHPYRTQRRPRRLPPGSRVILPGPRHVKRTKPKREAQFARTSQRGSRQIPPRPRRILLRSRHVSAPRTSEKHSFHARLSADPVEPATIPSDPARTPPRKTHQTQARSTFSTHGSARIPSDPAAIPSDPATIPSRKARRTQARSTTHFHASKTIPSDPASDPTSLVSKPNEESCFHHRPVSYL